jgi:Zn-dependent protease with chaperone function
MPSGWTSSAEPMRAIWYDGRVSRPRPVQVSLRKGSDGPRLLVQPLADGEASLELSAQQVGWPERWRAKNAPPRVIVDLREHGSLEVEDAAAWQDAMHAAGAKASLAEHMQTRWRVFFGVAFSALAALAAFYLWATPWAATQLTRQVPLGWETELAQRALSDLDDGLLEPSKLPPARQAELKARFASLARAIDPSMRRYGDYAPRFTLSFRSGFGPNAFALPGGTIVMTDALVAEAARQGLGDDALVGVLAHEIGHVVHRHTTRMMVEQAVLNVGLGLALGDVSHLLSIGSSVLTGLSYRRKHEAEADCFALALMRRSGLATAPMGDLLLGLGEAKGAAGTPPEKRKSASTAGSGLGDLLSTHPATAERARLLKQGLAQGC